MRLHDDPTLDAGIRRATVTLFALHTIAMAGVFTSSAITSIAAVSLAGTDRVAGWPSTIMLLGAAVAAYPAGRLMDRAGRRVGLSAGYGAGILGGLLAGWGVLAGSLWGLLAGVLALGAARAVSEQARYAAADVLPPRLRARAISLVVFAGTAGAVLGPWVIAPWADELGRGWGYPALAGPWFVTALVFAVTLVAINALLYPDPRDLARRIEDHAALDQPPASLPPARTLREVIATPRGAAPLLIMGFAQAAMVTVMTVTPVYMQHEHHGLSAITFVIAMHIFGMYGLSPLVGWLSDRWGRPAVSALGALLMIAACTLTPQWPATEPLAASLFLLGLGWNACFVAGSALWTDPLHPHERAGLQGAADVIISLCSAAGSLASGEVLAAYGYGAAALVGGLLALTIAAVSLWLARAPLPLQQAAPNPPIAS
jgi:MFS family permease